MESADSAVVAPENAYWHIELLRLIRLDVEQTSGRSFTIVDEDVCFGFVEWEDDGSVRVGTISGSRRRQLPREFAASLHVELLRLRSE